ncbi:hypothetical protein OEZ86_003781 [Tetradesmus obliquus]|nr:hypothetical protein OEZ86_003781 [Tetradesmus obliquus]
MFEDVSMKGPELQLVRASTYATLFASSASPRHTLTPWQFWQSLPVASKLLVVVVAAEACLWLGFISGTGASIATACSTDASQCWAERWQAMATTLAAQLCLAYLTLDAIHKENGLQLLTSISFTVLSGLLWLIFVAVLEPLSLAWRLGLAGCFIAAALLNSWLAFITYQQFGWRVHSKLACDYRRKHAVEKQQLYFLVSRFKTLLRFSWHALLVNTVSCLVLALTAQRAEAAGTNAALLTVPLSAMHEQAARFGSAGAAVVPSALLTAPGNLSAVLLNGGSIAGGADAAAAALPSASQGAAGSSAAVTGMLASLPVWLLPMAWLVVTHLAVARNSKRLEQLSTATVPLALLLPALPLFWAFSPQFMWPERLAVRVLLLAVPMTALVALLAAAWLSMRAVMRQFRLPFVQELLAEAADGSLDSAAHQDAPEQLQPLLDGSWLLKPSYVLELSTDLTTLRWAWNKYILLYYVDSITADADRLTLTLHMVLDPDLTLAFDDPKTYDQWESGLQLLLHMLTGAAPGCRFLSAGKSSGKGLPCIAGSSFTSLNSYTCGIGHANFSGTQLFAPQAAAAPGQVSQHSLVMTALNVQYGLQHGLVGSGEGSSSAAGQSVRRMSRNSFLRASR